MKLANYLYYRQYKRKTRGFSTRLYSITISVSRSQRSISQSQFGFHREKGRFALQSLQSLRRVPRSSVSSSRSHRARISTAHTAWGLSPLLVCYLLTHRVHWTKIWKRLHVAAKYFGRLPSYVRDKFGSGHFQSSAVVIGVFRRLSSHLTRAAVFIGLRVLLPAYPYTKSCSYTSYPYTAFPFHTNTTIASELLMRTPEHFLQPLVIVVDRTGEKLHIEQGFPVHSKLECIPMDQLSAWAFFRTLLEIIYV